MGKRYRHAIGPMFQSAAANILCLACLQWFAAGPALAAGDDENFFTHLHAEKVMANVTVSPGRAGPVNILIELETAEELPLAAKAVSVTLVDAQSGKKIETAPAEHVGENRWQVKATTLTAGRWKLGLGISMSDTDRVDVEAPILIASGATKVESATKHHHH